MKYLNLTLRVVGKSRSIALLSTSTWPETIGDHGQHIHLLQNPSPFSKLSGFVKNYEQIIRFLNVHTFYPRLTWSWMKPFAYRSLISSTYVKNQEPSLNSTSTLSFYPRFNKFISWTNLSPIAVGECFFRIFSASKMATKYCKLRHGRMVSYWWHVLDWKGNY